MILYKIFNFINDIKKYFDYFTNQLLQYDICTQYNFTRKLHKI